MKKQPLKALTIATTLGVSLLSSSISSAEQSADTPSLPLAELRRFSEVFDRIKSAYVEPVDDAELLEDAIRGMLKGLDPHSVYLEPEAFEDLQVSTSGEFGGVGIEVSQEEGLIRVITPIDDTPAQRAGIKAGDLITKIDDKSVQSLGLDEAIGLMRGEVGTPITLTINRDGESEPLEFTVKRAVIHVTSVSDKMLDNNIGYLRISQFQTGTGKDLAKAINKLTEQQQLAGLVLDLRNNPGGVLSGAVAVTDAFIDSGLIVYTEGRLNNANSEFRAKAETLLGDTPMVVLINGGSASASEIVAGALQDHKRAVIMGTRSFGKGSVQTVLPLNEERGLKLTTARYYTPSGRSIQAQGIRPDVQVNEAELRNVRKDSQVKERDLAGHLGNEQGEAEGQLDMELARSDYQLFEAVNLLKALAILGLKQ